MIEAAYAERSVANTVSQSFKSWLPKKIIACAIGLVAGLATTQAQTTARLWADSVYKTLTKNERIAQLMVVRLSGMDANRNPVIYTDKILDLVKRYNVGGVCLFQGAAADLATSVNTLQAAAKTPIMVTIDGEWGLGMRMKDVTPLPKQMMLGATRDTALVYRYGAWVAQQCRRAGIHVNYAPVVDINNNAANPVINDRSFGENRDVVAQLGIAYMRGMQDNGIMACAKHFPGHGDVAVDSHFDLPVINKTLQQLDSLELYPFRKLAAVGVGSMMMAHLYIPAIEKRANRASSISASNIKWLLRQQIGYNGLTFTDALEMQGVAKYFPNGDASVESLIAGNDMLCLPGDVPVVMDKINKAIRAGRLSWSDIELHCKKVLEAKYQYVKGHTQPISLVNIASDLNAGSPDLQREVAAKAITLVANENNRFFPLYADEWQGKKVLYVGINTKAENVFSRQMKTVYGADVVFYDGTAAPDAIARQAQGYDVVVSAVHNLTRSVSANFGLNANEIALVNSLQQTGRAITFVFGNAYALKNFCDAKNLVACYEDDDIIEGAAIDLLAGKLTYKGKLPVTVCNNLQEGKGIETTVPALRYAPADSLMQRSAALAVVDSIVNDGVAKNAFPGAVVLAIKDGKIFYEKAFGQMAKEMPEPMQVNDVFDMASVTKICATTIAVMKLYDEGKLKLTDVLGDHLPELRGNRQAFLSVHDVLLHQAGLVSFIPFYKETLLPGNMLNPAIFTRAKSDSFNVPVGNNVWMKHSWLDTMQKRILESPLKGPGNYVYSDNDFIYLGKIVERITGMPLNEYVAQTFYKPMGLQSIGFLPMQRIPMQRIVPTEQENHFRQQLVHGYVHDPGAAMFGGVAGHAGLFSTAYDIGAVMQMVMNGGVLNGRRYISDSTVKLFTNYQSFNSRRGFGFDKPDKDVKGEKEPYPSALVSTQTFGHTGFTGTCTWADPEKQVVYVFLSNRVNSTQPELLGKMNIRGKVQDALYRALL